MFLYSNESHSAYRTIVIRLSYVTKILPYSALCLYCSTAWLSSSLYSSIRQSIDSDRQRVQIHALRKWTLKVALADEIVHGINRSFGLILLISISHLFVDFITNSFFLVQDISALNLYSIMWIAINISAKFVSLCFVINTSVLIHQNVLMFKINS